MYRTADEAGLSPHQASPVTEDTMGMPGDEGSIVASMTTELKERKLDAKPRELLRKPLLKHK